VEANLAVNFDAITEVVGDRECIVFRDRRLTYPQVRARARRLANVLLDRGFEVRTERAHLQGWESGQDHLGLYLHNGNEYLEGMLGAYRARVAPFNVNYRYVAEELEYLLKDSGARGLLYHEAFAPLVDAVRGSLPNLELLLQVGDDSGHGLLDGALDYEEALAAASDAPPSVEPSPDDLYVLYTGGTTGMPKGVLWRQADIWVAALGGRSFETGLEFETLDEVVEAAKADPVKGLPAPPFMHGAAHWMAFNSFNGGGTIVIPNVTTTLDADDFWATVEREGVQSTIIVGDAFARPLVESLEQGSFDTSSMFLIVNGGAPMSPRLKARFLELLPHAILVDGLGSSETGTQARQMNVAGGSPTTGDFALSPGACVLSEDLDEVLQPGDERMGWLAQEGRVPLGYLGDEAKTAKTFPVIDGVRYSVPGDRAQLREDGTLVLHGRDSVTINSGGEKIFAEEVELAISAHADVYDVVVASRPSERWGQEVVAVVHLKDGATADEAALLVEAEKHVARYKLPKAFVFKEEIVRSPAGKADYRWAKQVAAGEA
jgi:fatty-acyl-CoA synthase